MMQVWFLLKILESILGAICMVYHALGFAGEEPLPHALLFCGTFFGFTLLSVLGVVSIAAGGSPPPLVEFVRNFAAMVMYIMASVVSMHYAENDFHLMYLSDFEEPQHPFFHHCRAQSIAALAAGSIHLLHTVLAFDVLISARRRTIESRPSPQMYYEEDEDRPVEEGTIRLYFLGKYVEDKLRRNVWFDNMCRRGSSRPTIFSLLPFSSRQAYKAYSHTDVEKNHSMEKYKMRKNTRRASSKTGDSVTSEELKGALDYSAYASPPHMQAHEPGVYEIVDERKGLNASFDESAERGEQIGHINLLEDAGSEATSHSTSAQKPILKRRSEEAKKMDHSFAAVETEQAQQPKQAATSKEKPIRTKVNEPLPFPKPQPLRTSSLEAIHALLKGPSTTEKLQAENLSSQEKSQAESASTTSKGATSVLPSESLSKANDDHKKSPSGDDSKHHGSIAATSPMPTDDEKDEQTSSPKSDRETPLAEDGTTKRQQRKRKLTPPKPDQLSTDESKMGKSDLKTAESKGEPMQRKKRKSKLDSSQRTLSEREDSNNDDLKLSTDKSAPISTPPTTAKGPSEKSKDANKEQELSSAYLSEDASSENDNDDNVKKDRSKKTKKQPPPS